MRPAILRSGESMLAFESGTSYERAPSSGDGARPCNSCETMGFRGTSKIFTQPLQDTASGRAKRALPSRREERIFPWQSSTRTPSYVLYGAPAGDDRASGLSFTPPER